MSAVLESKKSKASKVAGVTAALTGTMGDMIDQLYSLRERKRELEEQIKEIDGTYEGIQQQLMEKLETEKTDAGRGKLASCSISTSVVANVQDWDEVFKYVKRTGHFHLFQRRLTDAAYRELLDAGKKVPGVEPFVKKRLNVRVL